MKQAAHRDQKAEVDTRFWRLSQMYRHTYRTLTAPGRGALALAGTVVEGTVASRAWGEESVPGVVLSPLEMAAVMVDVCACCWSPSRPLSRWWCAWSLSA